MVKQSICALVVTVFLSWAASAHALPDPWVSDGTGRLGTVGVATGSVLVIGNMGVTMTDLAFDPSSNLYGILFTNRYQINSTTAQTTRISSLELTGANALVFATNGTLYARLTMPRICIPSM